MQAVSKTDIQALAADPAPETRAETVTKVASMLGADGVDPSSAALVEEILRIFAHDAAVLVRRAVAEQLKHEPDLPPDLALTLAEDIDEVAIPILRFSKALGDEELKRIVETEGQNKLRAIASRVEVGEGLSDALIERGDEKTVHTLLANAGSAPSEAGLVQIVERFPDHDKIQKTLASRETLPQGVIARMVAVVSSHVLEALAERKELPRDLTEDILKRAEERAYLELSRAHKDQAALAARLSELGRLTPNLAARALAMGDIPFFEHAAAHMSGLSLAAVQSLAYDTGSLGNQELTKKINASDQVAAFLHAGLSAYASIRAEDGAFDISRFRERMIERVLSQFGSDAGDIDPSDADAVLNRIGAAA